MKPHWAQFHYSGSADVYGCGIAVRASDGQYLILDLIGMNLKDLCNANAC